jgi:hypothetical protein
MSSDPSKLERIQQKSAALCLIVSFPMFITDMLTLKIVHLTYEAVGVLLSITIPSSSYLSSTFCPSLLETITLSVLSRTSQTCLLTT